MHDNQNIYHYLQFPLLRSLRQQLGQLMLLPPGITGFQQKEVSAHDHQVLQTAALAVVRRAHV